MMEHVAPCKKMHFVLFQSTTQKAPNCHLGDWTVDVGSISTMRFVVTVRCTSHVGLRLTSTGQGPEVVKQNGFF